MNSQFFYGVESKPFEMETPPNLGDNGGAEENLLENSCALNDYEIVTNKEIDGDMQGITELGALHSSAMDIANGEATRKLHLSLSAEKISLKSQKAKKKINKSIEQDRESTVQRHAVPINFTILPIELARNNYKNASTERDAISGRLFPSIVVPKLTSIQPQTPATVMCCTAVVPHRLSTRLPSTHPTATAVISECATSGRKNTRNFDAIVEAEIHAQFGSCEGDGDALGGASGSDETSEEINSSQFGVGFGSSTSPESLIDVILSAASSVHSSNSGTSPTDAASDGIKLLLPPPCTTATLPKVKTSIDADKAIVSIRAPAVQLISKSNDLKMPARTGTPSSCRNQRPASPVVAQPPVVVVHAPPPTTVAANMATPPLQTTTFKVTGNESLSSGSPSCSASEAKAGSVVSLIFPADLKCLICAEVFRDPRTLNCLHSFCFQCLDEQNLMADASMPQWSQPNINDQIAAESKYPRITVLSSKDVDQSVGCRTLEVSPARKSSFGFIRKKSLEKILLPLCNHARAPSPRLQIKCENKGDNIKVAPTTCNAKPTGAANRQIWCKVCKFRTELPIGGLRQLPQNFLLIRKIERFVQQTTELSACGLCCQETTAIYWCRTCDRAMCTLCKESHERQRHTTKHCVQDLAELRPVRKQRQQRPKQSQCNERARSTLKCAMHSGFKMNSFCRTCLQVSCSECLVLLHRRHEHEPITRAIGSYRRLLNGSAEQLRPIFAYAEQSSKQLTYMGSDFDQICDVVETQVEAFIQDYYNALVAHRKTLLQQVQRARESKAAMILERQADLAEHTNHAAEAMLFTQELMELASDGEILAFVGILLKRLDYCQQFSALLEPKGCDALRFLPTVRAPAPAMKKHQHGLPLYGVVTQQTVEPALCTLEYEGALNELRLQQEIQLVLQARDVDGMALCHGGLAIYATFKYKTRGAQTKPLAVEACHCTTSVTHTVVTDNYDGTYNIAFRPDIPGLLLLHVAISEKPIKGSPFAFVVRHLNPHSGVYHCCAYCSAKGNRQKMQCACPCRMYECNGCGHGHPGHPGSRHWSCCGSVQKNSECFDPHKM